MRGTASGAFARDGVFVAQGPVELDPGGRESSPGPLPARVVFRNAAPVEPELDANGRRNGSDADKERDQKLEGRHSPGEFMNNGTRRRCGRCEIEERSHGNGLVNGEKRAGRSWRISVVSHYTAFEAIN